MNRSFARWAALACTSAALALTSAGAFAQASITLNDPNCLSFTLGGTPPNQTLTCVQSTTPLCTLSGPATGTIGSPITIVNTCVPGATTYLWTGGACAGLTTKNCTDPGTGGYANGQMVTYTVTGTNGAGAGPASAGWQVTWTSTPPAAPGGCSISGAPLGNQTAGVSVNLTLNCTTGGAPSANGYVWTGTGASGTTVTVGPITVNATTTFTATASNAGGTSTAAAATVTIGGGGGGGIACAGFTNTHVLDLTWSSAPAGGIVTGYTRDVGGWGPNDAVVVRFTTPSGTSRNDGTLAAAEYQSGTFDMTVGLSATACDYSTARPGGQAPGMSFTVGSNTDGSFILSPSTTYYWNMKHTANGVSSNAVIVLQKPLGL